MISGIALIFIALSFTAFAVHARTHPDQVTSLPGLKSSLDFQHFAGYLNVDSSNNRNLFYWFTKASNSSTDLVLWLNGGPGCSSVSGFFTENGPFVVGSDGNVELNNFAWNTRSNVLWLEAPAGVRKSCHMHNMSPQFAVTLMTIQVGFSYSDVKDDYNTDDSRTASDNVAALVAFMNKFPEHSYNNIYLTGES
jgi:carboxypeptidase C (cathepsin A)